MLNRTTSKKLPLLQLPSFRPICGLSYLISFHEIIRHINLHITLPKNVLLNALLSKLIELYSRNLFPIRPFPIPGGDRSVSFCELTPSSHPCHISLPKHFSSFRSKSTLSTHQKYKSSSKRQQPQKKNPTKLPIDF